VKKTTQGRQKLANSSNPTFGNVSTVNTPPVAIGNSMSGFKSQIIHTADGCRVIGRDFAFTPAATGTVQNWCLTGGMPLTPACMPSTALRNLVQMYNKFKVNTCLFHYITSSSTTTTGDVVFYYQKNAVSFNVNWTNNSFLPFVLSDSNTVIGPQWTNHTVIVKPTGPYCSTDYAMDSESQLYTAGDIFLYSKTSSTESPGYVIFDYDITFKECSVSPRAGTLPTFKAQWQQFNFLFSGAKTTGVTTLVVSGNNTVGIGGTTITAPVFSPGEIYELVLDVTNSTFSTTTAANFMDLTYGNLGNNTTTITDGYCIFAVINSSAAPVLYATLVAATANSGLINAGATVTYNENIRGYCKLVGWAAGSALQNAY
jgi:hypothetical protein